MLTKQELEQNYSQFTNERLFKLATEDTASLSTEAKEVLQAEMDKRGIDMNLAHSIQLQQKKISKEEILEYCNKISELACPVCKRQHQGLNAAIVATVTSVILLTNYENRLVIACNECLDKKVASATNHNLLLGWWGIPSGFFRTLQALINNYSHKKEYKQAKFSKALMSFVIANSHKIEIFKNDLQRLQGLIIQDH